MVAVLLLQLPPVPLPLPIFSYTGVLNSFTTSSVAVLHT